MLQKILNYFYPKKILTPKIFVPHYRNLHYGRPALVISPGPSVELYSYVILRVIDVLRPIIIGTQYHFPDFPIDYTIFRNRKRFCTYATMACKKSHVFVSPSIPERIARKYCINWEYFSCFKSQEFLITFGGIIYDGGMQTGIISLALAHIMGCNPIYAVGFDGYSNQKSHIEDTREGQGEDFLRVKRYNESSLKGLQYLRSIRVISGLDGPWILTPTIYTYFYRDIHEYTIPSSTN